MGGGGWVLGDKDGKKLVKEPFTIGHREKT